MTIVTSVAQPGSKLGPTPGQSSSEHRHTPSRTWLVMHWVDGWFGRAPRTPCGCLVGRCAHRGGSGPCAGASALGNVDRSDTTLAGGIFRGAVVDDGAQSPPAPLTRGADRARHGDSTR